ncbi:acyltransferase [Sphingomonas gei]|uniref:Acyltransferase n=1 Tax=Sphingomonas gei TaxID=1395960 RepID=A0A4S1X7N8_9SPHN|nr:acyltransferase [Sphingomonas gei]TGX52174.1 acyltransferase [Sphingomonas gei]
MDAPQTDRLIALDLLRGLAALAIVTRHFPWPGDEVGFLPRDYLAVDLFFVLSGFVLARAWWPRLSQGEGQARFLLDRLIRLYPLYLLATLLAAAIALANGTPVGTWAIALGANLLFLPAPPDPATGINLFPFVYPAWSLLWELLANLVLALVAFRLRGPLLPAMLLTGALLLATTAQQLGSLDAGPRWSDFVGGGFRVLYGFFAGVALCWLHSRFPTRIAALPDWLIGLALLAIFAPATEWAFGAAYDFIAATLFFPLLVLLGANAHTTPLSRRIGAGLGGLSYGLYVLHQPVVQFATMLLPTEQIGASGVIGLAALVLVTLAVSWAATRWIDTPVRCWTRRRLRAQRSSAAPIVTTSSAAAP